MRINPLTPQQLTAEQSEVYAAIAGGRRAAGPQHFALAREDGSLNGPFNAFLLSPPVGGALQELGGAIRYGTELTARAREVAILLVATHWDSDFERAAHEAVGRAAGLTDTELRSLRRSDPDGLPTDEALVARVVLQLLEGDLDDTLWNEASVTLGERAVFELTALVGYYATLALQLRVFRV